MKDNLKLYGGIIVLVIMLIVGGIVLASKKGDKGDGKEKIKYVAKKDNTKKWVYKADYKKEVESATYVLNGVEYKATDIVAPYVNIDSSSADSANTNIKYRFKDAIYAYNRGARGLNSYVKEFDYKYYVNGTILSVVVSSVIVENNIVKPKHSCYNFDLTNGNSLTFDDIYNAAGFTRDSLEDRVAEEISDAIDEKMANMQNDSLELRKNNSMVNYKNSIKDESINVFLSEDNTMNVVVDLNIPVGSGSYQEILTIK